MKVSKEDIVGVLAAVENWFEERDRAAERQKWYDDLAVVAERVCRLPGAAGEVIEPEGVDLVPRLKSRGTAREYPIDGLGLRRRALDGEPRIMLDDNSATENAIEIDPFQLQPGEAAQVGDAIAAVLAPAAGRGDAAAGPAVEIGGEWEMRVDFLHGARIHRLSIEQRGAELSGRQRSAGFEGPVSGSMRGPRAAASSCATKAARSPICSTAKSATGG